MIIEIIIIGFGALLFLFSFWRRLKEDYIANQIFTTAFYILFGISIFVFLSRFLFDHMWFWFGLLGTSLGVLLGIYRFRLRIFETIEILVVSLLQLVAAVYLAEYFNNARGALGAFFVTLILYLIFNIFDKHYKGFSWYKSGRVGFSGMAVLGLFFLVRALVAVFFDGVVSFVGNEAILSGTLAFIAFLMLYNLSRSER